MAGGNLVDRLSSGESADKLVEELERAAGAGDVSSKRATRRWAASLRQRCVLSLSDEADCRTDLLGAPRNLSTGGAGVLLAQYVHPGATGVISLRRADGGAAAIRCTVVRCRHVCGLLHEVGVRFHEAIEPRDFNLREAERGVPQREHVEPAQLAGRVLFIEAEGADQEIVMHHLRQTQVDAVFAKNAAEGLKLLGQPLQLVVFAQRSPAMDAQAFAKAARAAGFAGPLVVTTTERSPQTTDALIGAGADAVLPHPAPEPLLLQTLAEHLPDPAADDERRSAQLVVLRSLCDDLRRSLAAEERGEAVKVAGTIQRVASEAGFEDVEAFVAGLEERLVADADVEPLIADLDAIHPMLGDAQPNAEPGATPRAAA